MRFAVAAALLASVGFTAAQSATTSASSSSSTSACDASNIVDACVAGIKPRTEACGGNDWDCLCAAYTDLATCYNNCPNDPTRSSVQNQVTQFCAAAKANSSTSSSRSGSSTATSASRSSSATGSSASASGTSASASSSGDFGSLSDSTSTGSSSSSSATGAAVPIHVPAGGALGVALGIVAML